MQPVYCIWVETQCRQHNGAQAQAPKPWLFCPCPGLPFGSHCIFTFEVSNETLDWQKLALQHLRRMTISTVNHLLSIPFVSLSCLTHGAVQPFNAHLTRQKKESEGCFQAPVGGVRKMNTFCMSFVMGPRYTEKLKSIALLSPVLQYSLTLSIPRPPLA